MFFSRLFPLTVALVCVPGFASAAAQQAAAAQAAPGGAQSAASSMRCPVATAEPTAADRLLARKSYKEAEGAYREALAKAAAPGDSEDARLGLVRALIGQDKVADAQAEAKKMLDEKPNSAVAEIASAEAAYRAADVPQAMAHARAALKNGSCDGRAADVLGGLYGLSGYYATAALLFQRAHLLRPHDENIRRDWIDSLPRKQRQAELARYLEGEHALSTDDATDYGSELEHLKARHPGECRVVSKSESTSTPMQPVFGDRPQPEAYGLDVFFNGKRRRMQIDTGASGIVLTQSAARALNLEPEYHIKTGGVGDEGELDSYLTHVHSIRIGDVEVQDCMVEVVQKSKLDVDGLIGMDVFRRWLVTLDYQNAQVRLASLPARPGAPQSAKLESDPLPSDVGDEEDTPHDPYVAPEMKKWLTIMRIGHEILLEARIKQGPIHYLVMDTGASLSNLSVPMAREAGKLHENDNIRVTGLSGEVKKIYSVDRVPLTVENLMIPETGYFAYDMTRLSHDSGLELSGLLGLPTLQRLTITIDYRDNLLQLSYDAKHDVQRF